MFYNFLHTQSMELRDDLLYDEETVQIVDGREQILQNWEIPMVKVLWKNHGVEETTWEH